MPLPAVSLGRRVSQWFLLGTAAPLVVLVMWLPALFMPDGESLSHGGLTLLMAGLCLALSVGSGIFQHTKAMVWGALMAISVLSMLLTATLHWWA